MATQLNDELIRRMLDAQGTNPVAPFDPTTITKAVGSGIDLADTIQARKQAQEDRVATLAQKIKEATAQQEQQGRVRSFAATPANPALRAEAYPAEEGKFQHDLALQQQRATSTSADIRATAAAARQGVSIDEKRRMEAIKIKRQTLQAEEKTRKGLDQIRTLQDNYNKLAEDKVVGGADTLGLIKAGFNVAASKLSKGRTNPSLKSFTDRREGLIATIKGLTGDVGVMTDQDAARLIKLLPDPLEPKAAADAKFEQVLLAMQDSFNRYRAAANTSLSELQSGEPIEGLPPQPEIGGRPPVTGNPGQQPDINSFFK